MDETKFQRAVKNRTNERIQTRIREFKGAISAALRKLDGSISCPWIDDFLVSADAQCYLKVLTSGNVNCGWPKSLWEKEEAVVMAEMFALMNEIERAIMAKPPREDDARPQEEGE